MRAMAAALSRLVKLSGLLVSYRPLALGKVLRTTVANESRAYLGEGWVFRSWIWFQLPGARAARRRRGRGGGRFRALARRLRDQLAVDDRVRLAPSLDVCRKRADRRVDGVRGASWVSKRPMWRFLPFASL